MTATLFETCGVLARAFGFTKFGTGMAFVAGSCLIFTIGRDRHGVSLHGSGLGSGGLVLSSFPASAWKPECQFVK